MSLPELDNPLLLIPIAIAIGARMGGEYLLLTRSHPLVVAFAKAVNAAGAALCGSGLCGFDYAANDVGGEIGAMSTMHPTDINAALVNLVRKRNPAWWRTAAIGLTPGLRPILALLDTRAMADGAGGYGNGVGDVDGRAGDGDGRVGDGDGKVGDGDGKVGDGDGKVGDGDSGGAGRGGRPYVLLVAGLRGQAADTPRMLAALDRFVQSAAAGASGVVLSAIVAANPDALAGGDWEPGAAQRVNLAVGYPPDGGFYFDETAPERRYLWRWICYQAPDLVVEVALSDDADGGVSSDRGSSGRAESGVAAAAARWAANAAAAGGMAARALDAAAMADDDSLVSALGRPASDAPGTIPGLRLTTHWTGLSDGLRALWRLTGRDADLPASAARRALDGRRSRSPLAVGRILAGRYGQGLDPVNYTQGVGISGRLQLAALEASYDELAGELAGVAGGIVSDPAGDLAGVAGGIASEPAGDLAGAAGGIVSDPAGDLAGVAGRIVSDPANVSEPAGDLAGAAGGIVSDPAIVAEPGGGIWRAAAGVSCRRRQSYQSRRGSWWVLPGVSCRRRQSYQSRRGSWWVLPGVSHPSRRGIWRVLPGVSCRIRQS